VGINGLKRSAEDSRPYRTTGPTVYALRFTVYGSLFTVSDGLHYKKNDYNKHCSLETKKGHYILKRRRENE